MNRQIFAWDRSEYQIRRTGDRGEWLWILGLFLAALVLFCINLGGVSLELGENPLVFARNWASMESQGRELQLNYSPVIQGWMAGLNELWATNPWATRGPGAFLAAASVPLLYSLGREIFPNRQPALLSALMYLMFWPVIRQGRLAMLDGPVLCFALIALLAAVRSRRNLAWSLGIGLGLSLLGAIQGIGGIAIAVVILGFLGWDTPRLLRSGYVGLGIFLGLVPAIAWYVAQAWPGGAQFLPQFGAPFANRPGGMAILEGAIVSFPWGLFSLWGLRSAWKHCNWGWAKLVLVWTGVGGLLIPLLALHFSVSLVLIYPALALAGGAALAEVGALPSYCPYPRTWIVALMGMAAIAGSLCLYRSVTRSMEALSRPLLVVPFASVALTLGVVSVLLERRDRQFAVMLFWGLYVSLLMFASSPYWNQTLF